MLDKHKNNGVFGQ